MTRRDQEIASLAIAIYESLLQSGGSRIPSLDYTNLVLQVMDQVPDICPVDRLVQARDGFQVETPPLFVDKVSQADASLNFKP